VGQQATWCQRAGERTKKKGKEGAVKKKKNDSERKKPKRKIPTGRSQESTWASRPRGVNRRANVRRRGRKGCKDERWVRNNGFLKKQRERKR
jgi:hypothetical protein